MSARDSEETADVDATTSWTLEEGLHFRRSLQPREHRRQNSAKFRQQIPHLLTAGTTARMIQPPRRRRVTPTQRPPPCTRARDQTDLPAHAFTQHHAVTSHAPGVP